MDLKEIENNIKEALSFEDLTSRIKKLDIIIEDTASSLNLPESIKQRVIGKCAEMQISAIAILDYGAEGDIY